MATLIARRGRPGGQCSGRRETVTPVISTSSHGSSLRRHSHSRKPAYSLAERRVSHAIFRLLGNRVSSHSRSVELGALFQSARPSSFCTHSARDDESAGLIGPKLMSSKQAMT